MMASQSVNDYTSYTKSLRLGLWRVLRQIKCSEQQQQQRPDLSDDDCAAKKSEQNPNFKSDSGVMNGNSWKLSQDSNSGQPMRLAHDKKRQKLNSILHEHHSSNHLHAVLNQQRCQPRPGQTNSQGQNKIRTQNSCFKRWRLSSKSLISGPTLAVLVLVLFLNLLLTAHVVEGCGPGRGVGRRRVPRKLTPLVYKQHVPNIPENNTPASGSSEGRISSGELKRFNELVANYNSDIVFRDDEGTGADRLMNVRCREKLNTLAISVMNQWPGVKLRVIEGWDDSTIHSANSLHYEGRAVDITTSDKDRSKYGMLARLAVEAGFDWVYYESRAHIHCSVKSDSSQGGRTGGCFSANSTVNTRLRGEQPLSSIVPGDQLLSIDSSGTLIYSPVLLFLDRNQTEVREFLQLTTSSGKQLLITPSHLLYTVRGEDSDWLQTPSPPNSESQAQWLLSLATISFARKVETGDWLLIADSESSRSRSSHGALQLERVTQIELKEEIGVYAPLTETGNVIVDGVVSSCYAVVDSQSLAHWSFFPIRILHNFASSLSHFWKQINLLISLSSLSEKKGEQMFLNMVRETVTRHDYAVKTLNSEDQGIHWYAKGLYSISAGLLPKHYLYGS